MSGVVAPSAAPPPLAAPEAAPPPDRLADRFVVKEGGRIFFVEAPEIDYIEAAGNYVRIHTGKTDHLIRETMHHVESQLDPSMFVRIHRAVVGSKLTVGRVDGQLGVGVVGDLLGREALEARARALQERGPAGAHGYQLSGAVRAGELESLSRAQLASGS